MHYTYCLIHEDGTHHYGNWHSATIAAKQAAEMWGNDQWTISRCGEGLLDPVYVESLRNQFLCVEA